MKSIIWAGSVAVVLTGLALTAPAFQSQQISSSTQTFKVHKSDAEWKQQLSPAAFDVLRRAGTEAAYSSPLEHNHEAGIFYCAGCGQALFSSKAKFESGTGWPSFFQPLKKSVVIERHDGSMGMDRTEILCSRCGGHLGHLFNDGPAPTGLRYCMNGVALKFKKGALLPK